MKRDLTRKSPGRFEGEPTYKSKALQLYFFDLSYGPKLSILKSKTFHPIPKWLHIVKLDSVSMVTFKRKPKPHCSVGQDRINSA